MPPPNLTDKTHALGWKLFFGLLMFLQVIATSIMWRTYDAVQETSRKGDLNEYKIDHIITPRLDKLEARTTANGPR